MDFNLSNPVANIVKAFFRGAIVSQDYAHCSFIVGLSDCSEAFLASCIPYLQLNIFSVDVDSFDLEVNT